MTERLRSDAYFLIDKNAVPIHLAEAWIRQNYDWWISKDCEITRVTIDDSPHSDTIWIYYRMPAEDCWNCEEAECGDEWCYGHNGDEHTEWTHYKFIEVWE